LFPVIRSFLLQLMLMDILFTGLFK